MTTLHVVGNFSVTYIGHYPWIPLTFNRYFFLHPNLIGTANKITGTSATRLTILLY